VKKPLNNVIGICALTITVIILLSSCQIEGILEQPTGSIFVTAFDTTGSVPVEVTWGSIFLDGFPRPETVPDTLKNIPIGSHEVKVKANTYEADEMSVEVFNNKTADATFFLTPAGTGSLSVVSEPEGSAIIIDQELTGQVTPHLFEQVESGLRLVSTFQNGYRTLSQALVEVVVDTQGVANASFELQPGTLGHQEGNIAYDFTLEDDFGNDVSLHNYRGYVVIISFFFKDCPNCIAEFPEIEQIYQDYLPYGVQVLGIDPMFFDDLEDVQFVRNELGLSFKLLLDWGSQTATDYGVIAYPTNFVIAQGGDIAARLLSVNYEMLAEILDGLLDL
jgi:peroxiredoxin